MGNIKIKNLTPHNITVIKYDGDNIVFKSEGIIRCSSNTKVVGNINGIQLTKTIFETGDSLPEVNEGTYYIVSKLVCEFNPHRGDFLIVDRVIRDENGKIIGCKGFSINPFYVGDKNE